MVPHGGKSGIFADTLVHVLPASRVTCTWPSLLPVQITPACLGDSAIAIKVPPYSGPMLSPVRPPEGPSLLLSFRVRSGLITCQLCPPLTVVCTYWLPA